jgi:hypothetical protein
LGGQGVRPKLKNKTYDNQNQFDRIDSPDDSLLWKLYTDERR